MKTTSDDDDDNTAEVCAMTDAVLAALDAITSDPRLAMEVIEEIAYLTRRHGDVDPETVTMCDETRYYLAEIIADAVDKHWQKEMAREVGKITALHELGRRMLGELDESGTDEGLRVLTAGIAGALADHLAGSSELVWSIGIDDEDLIERSIEDGITPNLAPGALDRARTAMREAGWLSWRVDGAVYFYTLNPPVQWHELVKDIEAAMTAVIEPVQ